MKRNIAHVMIIDSTNINVNETNNHLHCSRVD